MVLVRFGFLGQKLVQTGLARFWLGFFGLTRFFLVWLGFFQFSSVFSGLGLVRFFRF